MRTEDCVYNGTPYLPVSICLQSETSRTEGKYLQVCFMYSFPMPCRIVSSTQTLTISENHKTKLVGDLRATKHYCLTEQKLTFLTLTFQMTPYFWLVTLRLHYVPGDHGSNGSPKRSAPCDLVNFCLGTPALLSIIAFRHGLSRYPLQTVG